jgi:predicted nucleic acid-binding protein
MTYLLDSSILIDALNNRNDVTIAAVALAHSLVLVTDNQKDFPMPELQLAALPDSSA